MDVFDGAIPTDDLALVITSWRSAGSHPTPDAFADKDAVLGIVDSAGPDGVVPLLNCSREIIGMNDPQPSSTSHLLARDAGEFFAPRANIEDGASSVGGPRDSGVQFDGVAVV